MKEILWIGVRGENGSHSEMCIGNVITLMEAG
jgi:hypothetical protein